MVARDIKIKLGYQKYLMSCENELLRKVYEEVIKDETGDWTSTVGAGGSNFGREI